MSSETVPGAAGSTSRYRIDGIDAILERMLDATGCRTQTELAMLLDIGKAAISDAKRRGIIPADWYLKLCRPPHLLNPCWLESGNGAMRIRSETVSEFPADYGESTSSGFECVPLALARPGTGPGQLALSADRESAYAFRRDWLAKRGEVRQLRLLRISGETMRPVLLDEDMVLVDESQKAILEGKIYVIRIDGDIVVKRETL